MGSNADEKIGGYALQWKIENLCHLWWLKNEGIESPTFIADGLEKSKWTLLFYPRNRDNGDNIGIFLQRKSNPGGPGEITVKFQFAILGKDGSVLKETNAVEVEFLENENSGYDQFEKRERYFVNEREKFLPEDTLTILCTLWIAGTKPNNVNKLFATTDIKLKRRYFEWNIAQLSAFKSELRKKFEDNLISLDVVLYYDFNRLDMDMNLLDKSIYYISYSISATFSDETRENYGITKYFKRDLNVEKILPSLKFSNTSKRFPNDVLSLNFEFVISTFQNSGWRNCSDKLKNEVYGKEKCRDSTVLTNDLKFMHNDAIFSDVELRTSTKSFPAHKAILGTRSPVFRSMFSSDMKERKSGHVDITDFEDDTVSRMLLYLYTDFLEDLQFESASKLYKIADKYQIWSLKSRCSSFLEENLNPSNVCDVLLLADLYSDDELKISAERYILGQRKEFFCSNEWKDFTKSQVVIAADLMHKKIIKGKMYVE